jgi:hypothetical protein
MHPAEITGQVHEFNVCLHVRENTFFSTQDRLPGKRQSTFYLPSHKSRQQTQATEFVNQLSNYCKYNPQMATNSPKIMDGKWLSI